MNIYSTYKIIQANELNWVIDAVNTGIETINHLNQVYEDIELGMKLTRRNFQPEIIRAWHLTAC